MKDIRLVNLNCPECKRQLRLSLPNSEHLCIHCNLWITFINGIAVRTEEFHNSKENAALNGRIHIEKR